MKSIIKGWKGFKLIYLNQFVLADFGDQGDSELDFTDDNALDLMKNSTVFDTWISGVISDLGNFTSKDSTEKLKELKTTSKSLGQA